MKFIILILFFTLMPVSIFCQETEIKTGKSFRIESSAHFSLNVIKPLSISKSYEMIELISFKPGEVRRYDNADIAVTFDISGNAEKNVWISARMHCLNKEIVIEEAVFEYKEGNIWKSIEDASFYDGTDLVFNLAINLNNHGTRSLRIYPKKINAGTALNTNGDVIYLIIVLNCEYTK